MSATLAAALAVCQAGDEIVSMMDVYGGTSKLFELVFARLGIKARMVPFKDVPKIEKYCNKKTKMMFLETPTNPTLRCVDLAELSKVGQPFWCNGRRRNTFATPILQQRWSWDAM